MKRALFAAALLFGLTVLARAEVCSSITNEVVTVDGRNDEWTGAALKVQPGDVIMVLAGGTVRFTGLVRSEVTPKGALGGTGRLEMKVGTGTVVPVGDRWVGAFREPGAVKFRIKGEANNDTHAAMSGSYTVRLIVVPASTLPPAVKVEAE